MKRSYSGGFQSPDALCPIGRAGALFHSASWPAVGDACITGLPSKRPFCASSGGLCNERPGRFHDTTILRALPCAAEAVDRPGAYPGPIQTAIQVGNASPKPDPPMLVREGQPARGYQRPMFGLRRRGSAGDCGMWRPLLPALAASAFPAES
jgi:hypothetical protein